jgi:hypothetical protein
MIGLVIGIGGFLACASTSPSSVPRAPVETLSGARLELSRDIAPHLAVLIIGFTKASRTQATEWSRRLEPELPRISKAQVFQVAVLGDVPWFLRGFVIRQIRASVPKAMHPRSLLALEDADAWRRLAEFGDADAAYLVLLGHGELLWRSHGPLTEERYRGLTEALDAGSKTSSP